MKRSLTTTLFIILLVASAGIGLSPVKLNAEELVVKSCAELINMATTLRDDLKTVDTVLGYAIDAGNLERIRNYKLKRAAAKKSLESVLKAIEIKECATVH